MTDLASGWSECRTPHPVVRHTLFRKNGNARAVAPMRAQSATGPVFQAAHFDAAFEDHARTRCITDV
ncbi:hypothetical protein [Paraburkholderia solisilvae]|uniref:hypothetical protein n=1 Tax=Paraburkholderia solisilvae TaxID=624376 RepID=UPI003644585E